MVRVVPGTEAYVPGREGPGSAWAIIRVLGGFTDQNAQNECVSYKNEENFGLHPGKWAINEVIQVDMKYLQ